MDEPRPPVAGVEGESGQEADAHAAPTPEALLGAEPVALATWARVSAAVSTLDPVEVRVSRSQVALRRRRGFAYLWLPRRYLGARGAPVVVTVVLGRADGSPRWKEVAHPGPRDWVHHLEVTDPAQVDDEVASWLHEAWERAG